MNLSYQILYWRDIPAQVVVRSGRDRLNRPLSSRFQEAIDAAAMRAQATSEDDYLEGWRAGEWQPANPNGPAADSQAFADSLVAELEAAYPPERLRALRDREGWDGTEGTEGTEGT